MKRKAAQRRGQPLEDLEDEVEEYTGDGSTIDSLPSHLFWIWEAFALLSRTRVVNQTGPQPILTSELLAYCQMERIVSEADRKDLLFHINNLDLVWLKDAHAKIEKRQEEAKKESEKKAKLRGKGRGRV